MPKSREPSVGDMRVCTDSLNFKNKAQEQVEDKSNRRSKNQVQAKRFPPRRLNAVSRTIKIGGNGDPRHYPGSREGDSPMSLMLMSHLFVQENK